MIVIEYCYLQQTVHVVPIISKVVSLNPAHGEVYSLQLYVIKFVNNLQQVCGFHRVPPPIKLRALI
jgi:hypothetical protein